jgi:ankyrin repeat protein
MTASENGHLDIVGLLLGHGASIDAVDDDGDGPLTRAARNGHSKGSISRFNRSLNCANEAFPGRPRQLKAMTTFCRPNRTAENELVRHTLTTSGHEHHFFN